MPSLEDLKKIAEVEFADIVKDSLLMDHKLRIFLKDKSFVDVNLSMRLPDKFGYHWEVMDSAGSIFRYDNFPDKNWNFVSTYPYHFHNGSQGNVEISPFPISILEGFRAFLQFIREKLKINDH